MATGRPAFPGPTSAAIFDAILHAAPTSPLRLNPECPAELERIISKALEKDREMRYQSASDIRTDLKRLKRDTDSGRAAALGAGLAPAPEGRPQGAPLQMRWRIVLAAALVLVIGGAVGYRHFRKPPGPPMRVVPFTSFPGHEVDARFSPDGNQIAFSWDGEKKDNWDIYVKLIGEEKPLRLTTDPGEDLLPAWSPDGRYIAFCRWSKAEYGIYLVPALGGPERKLHSAKPVTAVNFFPLSLDWSPDGKYLVYREGRPGEQPWNLSLLAVENPEDRRALTSPSGPHAMEYFPRFSPDGLNVAFVRASGSAAAVDIYVVGTAGGEPKRLTFDNVNVYGLDWTADGAYVVFSSNRQGTYRLWKVRASGGEPEALPVGQQDAMQPSVSRDGRRLAYTQESVDTNIWRYEVPRAPGRSTPPTKLIASTQFDGGQQFSPDGSRIVFSSTRSGSYEIWVCDSDGSNPRQLTFFGGPDTGTPRWSPDGRQIVFDSTPQGHGDIFVVSAEGGRPHRLTMESSNDCVPSWSRDGRWIYFASDRTGAWQVWKMPAEGGRAVQVTKQGGFAAFESLDSKTLYYTKGYAVPGLWKVPVEAGEETPVLPQPAGHLWRNWGLTAEGIYFYNAGTKAIEFFSFATHKVTQIVKPEKSPVAGATGLAVSPDGRWILFAQVDQEVSDIMLVENFRW
jgi:Tol biopolymer transport system component